MSYGILDTASSPNSVLGKTSTGLVPVLVDNATTAMMVVAIAVVMAIRVAVGI